MIWGCFGKKQINDLIQIQGTLRKEGGCEFDKSLLFRKITTLGIVRNCSEKFALKEKEDERSILCKYFKSIIILITRGAR